MPGDGFSFTVLIRCYPDIIGFRSILLKIIYNFYLFFRNFINRCKAFFYINAKVLAFAGDSTITRFSTITAAFFSCIKLHKVNHLGTKLQNKPLSFFIFYYFWTKLKTADDRQYKTQKIHYLVLDFICNSIYNRGGFVYSYL